MAVLYQGLTRQDPTLYHPIRLDSNELRSAEITGTLTGGLFDASGSLTPWTYITFVSDSDEPSPVTLNTGTRAASTGEFALSVNWLGHETTTGRLFAIQGALDGSGNLTEYTGYAAGTSLNLNDGDSLTNEGLDLKNTVETKTINYEAKVPDDHTLRYLLPYVSLQGRGGLTASPTFDANATTELLIPEAETISTNLLTISRKKGVTARYNQRVIANPRQSNLLSIELANAPSLLNPSNNASGIDTGYTFRFESADNAINLIRIEGQGTANKSFTGGLVYVFTDRDEFELPDLSNVGIALDSDSEYRWRVLAGVGFNSIDEVSSPQFRHSTSFFGFGPSSPTALLQSLDFRGTELRLFRTAD